MDITKIMGDLYRYADTMPDDRDRWLVELAASALEHTHLHVPGDKEDVLLHVVLEELDAD